MIKIETNKNMLNNAKCKNWTDSKPESKTHKQCTHKNKKRERKVIESLGALFLPHPGRTFLLIKPLNWW